MLSARAMWHHSDMTCTNDKNWSISRINYENTSPLSGLDKLALIQPVVKTHIRCDRSLCLQMFHSPWRGWNLWRRSASYLREQTWCRPGGWDTKPNVGRFTNSYVWRNNKKLYCARRFRFCFHAGCWGPSGRSVAGDYWWRAGFSRLCRCLTQIRESFFIAVSHQVR